MHGVELGIRDVIKLECHVFLWAHKICYMYVQNLLRTKKAESHIKESKRAKHGFHTLA